MTWDHSTAWWVVTGLLIVMELTSGTFYLLMLAIGTAAGALGAHAGLNFPGQLVAAAVVGGAAVTLWHRRLLGRPPALRSAENPDVNLDVGSRVQVDAWGADRHARVNYRGAAWSARNAGSRAIPRGGRSRVVRVDGLMLWLESE